MAELEKDMEAKLIKQLCQGISQWKYRPDIRTEDDLWNNFRDKLNRINTAILDGKPITDNEFRQVKAFINEKAATPYTAGCWLAGENGVAQIPLIRDDTAIGTITLKVINNREVAGGNSSYEVINQYMQKKADPLDKDRRFDVTLLINGMPMIQIELKNRAHPFMDAYRQLKKYDKNENFRGLFGMVQMFVCTNGVDTQYIAADTISNLNERFLTSWIDKDNHPVDDYLDFAKEVLSIPAAHNMVGKYSVMDKTKEKVILLRPYQIHAIEAIRKASYMGKSGFIWHTTGSGKTLTSYNVTKNLLDIPSIDKTLFLIDRKDLDTQTTTEFQSYAETDSIDVDETKSTHDLEKKLLNNQKQTIVTTIQKLQNIMKRYSDKKAEENPKLAAKRDKLKKLRIAFIVDECHRTVSAETKRYLERYFSESLWYGFTGTPIFAENRKAVKGDLPTTTAGLYGDCLHNYTIKEAIKNKAVLGFNVEFMDNYTDDGLANLLTELKLATEKSAYNLSREEMEHKVLAYYAGKGVDFYGEEKHKREVIKYILNKCEGKFGLNKGEGHTYDALLTVKSIDEAQKYYRLFKEMIKKGAVSEKILRKLPDFPKIAITYTVGENQDGALANQDEMKESLADYNAMFGTSWGLDDNLRGYNEDLQKRLARKESKYKTRDEQLDLVIVVDRLLTGFDAPCLSTIFIDRPPMPPQNIIQAFSRTNRIFDNTKKYGQVVIFRTKGIYKKAVDDAIILYSNGGSQSDIMAPTFEESQKQLQKAIQAIRKIASKPQDVSLTEETDELTTFAKAYQELDHAIATISVYTEWYQDALEDTYGLSEALLDAYKGKYTNVIEELRIRKNRDYGEEEEVEIPDVDIEYELEATSSATINYRYIIALVQRCIPEEDTLVHEQNKKEEALIKESLEKLAKTNPKITSIIQDVWEDIMKFPWKYTGKNANQLIQDKIDRIVERKACDLATIWKADPDEILFHAHHYKVDDDYVDITLNYDAYKADEGKLSKLKYLKAARQSIREAVEKDIVPLMSF